MTKDSENKLQEINESPEPSPEPLAGRSSNLRLNSAQIRDSHEMLTGFREGIREGTYHGRHLIHIAQGLMFLDTMIGQSQAQLELAKRQEKEALKRAKDTIAEVGGKTADAPPESNAD